MECGPVMTAVLAGAAWLICHQSSAPPPMGTWFFSPAWNWLQSSIWCRRSQAGSPPVSASWLSIHFFPCSTRPSLPSLSSPAHLGSPWQQISEQLSKLLHFCTGDPQPIVYFNPPLLPPAQLQSDVVWGLLHYLEHLRLKCSLHLLPRSLLKYWPGASCVLQIVELRIFQVR